jgi:hypothetical protein
MNRKLININNDFDLTINCNRFAIETGDKVDDIISELAEIAN